MNLRDRRRISTAISHLQPARHRLNLTIAPHCHVPRLTIDGSRVSGVEVERGGMLQRVEGARVTLSAGAINSPAILLRSGIGPAGDLAALGIEPRVDLPGVGATLFDHFRCFVSFETTAAYVPDLDTHQVMLRYTASGSDEPNDMQMHIFTPRDYVEGEAFPARGSGRAWLSMAGGVQRPRGSGSVTLASADPDVAPRIDLNYAGHPEDMRRLVDGVRLAWRLAHAAPLSEFVGASAAHGGMTLDDATLADDAALERYVRGSVNTIYHPVATCRMGPADDDGAVVDQYLRVRGVDNLRVVDASVMPAIVRANTNLTTIVIAERAAEWMRASDR